MTTSSSDPSPKIAIGGALGGLVGGVLGLVVGVPLGMPMVIGGILGGGLALRASQNEAPTTSKEVWSIYREAVTPKVPLKDTLWWVTVEYVSGVKGKKGEIDQHGPYTLAEARRTQSRLEREIFGFSIPAKADKPRRKARKA